MPGLSHPQSQAVAPAAQTSLLSISVSGFRNYDSGQLAIDAANVLLIGPNGAGKTNLMEAVSLLAPGRGLRRAKGEHLPRAGSGRQDWAVSAQIEAAGEMMSIGTGVLADSESGRRVMRRDGVTVSQSDIGRVFSASWLTPRMDGIFIDSPGARRRFLDRLVIAFDPAHIGRTSRYEKMLRERMSLLSEGGNDHAWFAAIEASLAEAAIAVTAARQSLISDLNDEAADGWFGFPGVRLALEGTVEGWLETMSALEAEDRFIQLARMRRLAGDTALPGPHASDLVAVNSVNNTPAYLASTGQQKALLIAVVLAHARLQARRLRRPPVLLLDDVVAHLDIDRRAALFEAVGAVGGQTWFSGTDEDDFNGLEAQTVHVEADNGMARFTTSGNETNDR